MGEGLKRAKAAAEATRRGPTRAEREAEVPGELEWFEGKLRKVVNSSRLGWWRFNAHYDRDGYCDNPARGY